MLKCVIRGRDSLTPGIYETCVPFPSKGWCPNNPKGRQETTDHCRHFLMPLYENGLWVAAIRRSKAGPTGREHRESKILRCGIII